MRILFAQSHGWLGLHAGAQILQRRIAAACAAQGHEVFGVVRQFDPEGNDMPHPMGGDPKDPAQTMHQRLEDLHERKIAVSTSELGTEFEADGARVVAVPGPYERVCHAVVEVCRRHRIDAIVTMMRDDGPPFLESCHRAADDRVIYALHTVQLLPSGPLAFRPDERRSGLLRQGAGSFAVSEFARDYVREHCGVDSFCFYPIIPFEGVPRYQNFETGRVVAINPSKLKGLDIVAGLAESMPEVPFAAVPTWNTTPEDRDRLAALPNMELWQSSDDVETIFSRTSVYLAPAIWHETFGMTVVESMLRGIPCLASDIGAHREAKLGVPYVLPANPLEYHMEQGRVVTRAPATQPIEAWREAVTELLSDRARYEEVADASYEASRRFSERAASAARLIDYIRSRIA